MAAEAGATAARTRHSVARMAGLADMISKILAGLIDLNEIPVSDASAPKEAGDGYTGWVWDCKGADLPADCAGSCAVAGVGPLPTLLVRSLLFVPAPQWRDKGSGPGEPGPTSGS